MNPETQDSVLNPKNASSSNLLYGGLLAAFTSLAVFIVLVFIYPYAEGYLNTRTPLAHYLEIYWLLEDWQQCWFVIPACVFIIWKAKDTFPYDRVNGHWTGLPVLLLSFLFYYLGYLIDNYYVGFAAIQLYVAGIIIWFLGWSWMRVLIFPWMFMVFAWPLLFLDTMLGFPLRLAMVDSSYHLLNFLGISCVKIGSAVVSSPEPALGIAQGERFAVDIANPCSGIRSLFALMMVSSLYAYFAVRPLWKQILVFCCSIPLAILGNMVRIFMLVVGTLLVSSKFAIGTLEQPSWFHMAAGFVVFAVALGGLLLISEVLQMNWRQFISKWTNNPLPPSSKDDSNLY
ncbi:MAG: exosortase/archaeosortase family protein [Chthoniobacterales bacterium]